MSAPVELYHDVWQRIERITRRVRMRRTSVDRLALLVTGIIAAQSTVLAKVAAQIFALDLTRAANAEHVARRLRRALSDGWLEPATCYTPVLEDIIDWEEVRGGRRQVVLIVDESSKADHVHLLRVSLAYQGGSVPLAWRVWEQNAALSADRYWQELDRVLAQTAAGLPVGLEVVVVADRAYDTPPFVDRITALGWHWVVRCKARGTLRFRDHQGRVWVLADVLRTRLRRGGRWKARGHIFKDAGWRPASVVGIWAASASEALVVLTDLPCRWDVLPTYQRRFWTEPGFRNDKGRGWQWEQSQVQGLPHHQRLLLAMAWAALVMLCLGVQQARDRLAARTQRRRLQPSPLQHPRESLFTLGLRTAQCWLLRKLHLVLRWHLPDLDALSWYHQWRHHHIHAFLFQPVRP